jgi:hypothetical protein
LGDPRAELAGVDQKSAFRVRVRDESRATHRGSPGVAPVT